MFSYPVRAFQERFVRFNIIFSDTEPSVEVIAANGDNDQNFSRVYITDFKAIFSAVSDHCQTEDTLSLIPEIENEAFFNRSRLDFEPIKVEPGDKLGD